MAEGLPGAVGSLTVSKRRQETVHQSREDDVDHFLYTLKKSPLKMEKGMTGICDQSTEIVEMHTVQALSYLDRGA